MADPQFDTHAISITQGCDHVVFITNDAGAAGWGGDGELAPVIKVVHWGLDTSAHGVRAYCLAGCLLLGGVGRRGLAGSGGQSRALGA
jgi:hypothetical protein